MCKIVLSIDKVGSVVTIGPAVFEIRAETCASAAKGENLWPAAAFPVCRNNDRPDRSKVTLWLWCQSAAPLPSPPHFSPSPQLPHGKQFIHASYIGLHI